MGKGDHYVETLLWRLKEYTGSLRIEVTGYERTPGLAEFARVPCVERMVSKLASEKTRLCRESTAALVWVIVQARVIAAPQATANPATTSSRRYAGLATLVQEAGIA